MQRSRAFCGMCDASFTKTCNLTRHIESVHASKPPMYCVLCNSYKNSRRDSMRKHLAKTHGLSDKLCCPLCVFSGVQLVDHVMGDHIKWTFCNACAYDNYSSWKRPYLYVLSEGPRFSPAFLGQVIIFLNEIACFNNYHFQLYNF